MWTDDGSLIQNHQATCLDLGVSACALAVQVIAAYQMLCCPLQRVFPQAANCLRVLKHTSQPSIHSFLFQAD